MLRGDDKDQSSSEAMRLIKSRVEGMCLMLPTVERWEEALAGILNPPNRKQLYTASICFLPIDGNITLAGDHGVGLILDVQYCYLDPKNAIAVNHLKLEKIVSVTRSSMEISANIERAAICGVLLHPDRKAKQGEINYAERFNAIDKKIHTSLLLGKMLPIILLGPSVGVVEYTIQEQNIDMMNYLMRTPDAPNREHLMEMLMVNTQYNQIGCPMERNQQNEYPAYDMNRITRLQDLMDERLYLIKNRNWLYRNLMAIEYEGDLYPVGGTIQKRSQMVSISFDAADRRIEDLDKIVQAEFMKDPSAVLLASHACRLELEIYEELQKMKQPNIWEINFKISKNLASEEDMCVLNTIDLACLHRELALESIAECKVKYIQNKILSNFYPGDFKCEFNQAVIMTTKEQKMMLDAITKAMKSKHQEPWSVCLQELIAIAAKGIKEESKEKPKWNLFSDNKPALINHDLLLFYTFITEQLSKLPTDRLAYVTETAYRRSVQDTVRQRTIVEVLTDIANIMQPTYKSARKLAAGRDVAELIAKISPFQRESTSSNNLSIMDEAQFIAENLDKIIINSSALNLSVDHRQELMSLKAELVSAISHEIELKERASPDFQSQHNSHL